MRISLIGIYPPPWGGVSVHLQRLDAFLKAGGFDSHVYDPRWSGAGSECSRLWHPKIRGIQLAWLARRGLVHFHVSDVGAMKPALRLAEKGGRVIVTLHNGRIVDELMTSHPGEIPALKKLAAVVAVSEPVRGQLRTLGIEEERLHCIPAYLHPVVSRNRQREIHEQFPRLAEADPVLTANASNANSYNGRQLYGLDMMLEAVAVLKKEFPRILAVFVQSVAGDPKWERWVGDRVSELGIQSHFTYSSRPCSYPDLLAQSHVFVRPTNTDGDAISIREALYLNKAVAASDCVPRPAGVRTFRTRDMDSLLSALRLCIAERKPLDGSEKTDFSGQLIDLYKSLA